jgi:dephospho-CoA kinase
MKKDYRIIGITGGIATGKSTVAYYLANHYHFPILDADILAREAVNPNSPILQVIIDRYGEGICLDNGQLNRQQLGEIIFKNSTEKVWLENQIHPYVRQQLEVGIKACKENTIVLVIPLLFEAKMTDLVTEIWVVTCPLERQIKRLIERNSLSKDQAINRINSQMSLKEKMAMADQVIDNSTTLDDLYFNIDQAVERFS